MPVLDLFFFFSCSVLHTYPNTGQRAEFSVCLALPAQSKPKRKGKAEGMLEIVPQSVILSISFQLLDRMDVS